jgi:hypothetical protein
VIDIFGREVAKGILSEGKATFNLSGLSIGIYNIILDFQGQKFIAGKVVLAE